MPIQNWTDKEIYDGLIEMENAGAPTEAQDQFVKLALGEREQMAQGIQKPLRQVNDPQQPPQQTYNPGQIQQQVNAQQHILASPFSLQNLGTIGKVAGEIAKPVVKAGVMGVQGGMQSIQQLPNAIEGVTTGDYTKFLDEGRKQRSISVEAPWLGNINPQNDPRNTAGAALQAAGTVLPFTAGARAPSVVGAMAKQGLFGVLRGSGRTMQDVEASTDDIVWAGVTEGAISAAIAGIFKTLANQKLAKLRGKEQLKLYHEAKAITPGKELGEPALRPTGKPITETRQVVSDLKGAVKSVKGDVRQQFNQMVEGTLKPIQTSVNMNQPLSDAVQALDDYANVKVTPQGGLNWNTSPFTVQQQNDTIKILTIIKNNQSATPYQAMLTKQAVGNFYVAAPGAARFNAFVTIAKNSIDDAVINSLDDVGQATYAQANQVYQTMDVLNNAEKALSSSRSAENYARLLLNKGKVLQKEVLSYLTPEEAIKVQALANAQNLALKGGLAETTGVFKGLLNALAQNWGKVGMYGQATVGQALPSLPYNIGSGVAQYGPTLGIGAQRSLSQLNNP